MYNNELSNVSDYPVLDTFPSFQQTSSRGGALNGGGGNGWDDFRTRLVQSPVPWTQEFPEPSPRPLKGIPTITPPPIRNKHDQSNEVAIHYHYIAKKWYNQTPLERHGGVLREDRLSNSPHHMQFLAGDLVFVLRDEETDLRKSHETTLATLAKVNECLSEGFKKVMINIWGMGGNGNLNLKCFSKSKAMDTVFVNKTGRYNVEKPVWRDTDGKIQDIPIRAIFKILEKIQNGENITKRDVETRGISVLGENDLDHDSSDDESDSSSDTDNSLSSSDSDEESSSRSDGLSQGDVEDMIPEKKSRGSFKSRRVGKQQQQGNKQAIKFVNPYKKKQYWPPEERIFTKYRELRQNDLVRLYEEQQGYRIGNTNNGSLNTSNNGPREINIGYNKLKERVEALEYFAQLEDYLVQEFGNPLNKTFRMYCTHLGILDSWNFLGVVNNTGDGNVPLSRPTGMNTSIINCIIKGSTFSYNIWGNQLQAGTTCFLIIKKPYWDGPFQIIPWCSTTGAIAPPEKELTYIDYDGVTEKIGTYIFVGTLRYPTDEGLFDDATRLKASGVIGEDKNTVLYATSLDNKTALPKVEILLKI